MKAIHAFGPKDVRLVEVPDPVAGLGQVLVLVRASGICGSDKGLWWHGEPRNWIGGHEVAGEVVAIGPGVRYLQVGDRVAINNVGGCGTCPACRAGAFVKCPTWTGALDINGGFGELVAAPERNCMCLADAINYDTGSQIFDNFGTPFSAVELAQIGEGDDVLITGCGPIGLGAVILAKLRGAFVIAADPLPKRRELVARLGANVVLPPDEALPGAVRDLTNGLGVRVALECSGKSPSYPLAIASLRIGGMLISVGEGAQYDLHPSPTLIRRHLTFAGSWYSSMQQGQRLQEMILQMQIMPAMLVTNWAPLAEFPALFQKVCEQPDEVVKALIVRP